VRGLKQTLTVATVGDEKPLRLAVRRILRKYRVDVSEVGVTAAYHPTHFTSGEQFLESVAGGADFDLLLLDLELPGISGLDVLTELDQRNRSVLTIMIISSATFETAVRATKLGAFDFLLKPFSPEELRHAVRKATDQLVMSREARRLTEEQRQVRFNFISTLAHELKAPLNAIENYLRILQMDEPPERLPMIDRSLIRLDGMRKLILELLDLTRIESGQMQRSFALVDVRTPAWAAIDLFAAGAADREIAMALRATDPVEMMADPAELEMVFNNLISNAVKYNRDGGDVTVTVSREGDIVTITVADTGIGMTPEESAKLFTEFVRIKNKDTDKILGTGLGLSTIRKLARLYGGDATVQSEKGVGSLFTVTLRDAVPREAAQGDGVPHGAANDELS